MNRHKISPNAIVVALFGLAISGYVAITNKSILGFERVKLFVCGAGFIGICRSGRGRPRPFG